MIIKAPLYFEGLCDHALIYVDGVLLGETDRNNKESLLLEVPENGIVLEVLTENLGRINYGFLLGERKGISGGIRHDRQFLFNYEVYTLPMTDLDNLQFKEYNLHQKPAFYKFILEAEICEDTFLDMKKWGKGFVVLNGINLGRYWNKGPQFKLFVPKEFLKETMNEIIVFEENSPCEYLEFSDEKE